MAGPEKMQQVPQQGELPAPASSVPSDPGPVLTLQPSPLPLSFSLRKTERCPFNLTGI